MANQTIIPEIEANHESMTAWRRDIHANPELGFEEYRTSAMVAEKLKSWGLEVHQGLGKTGVIGTLRVGNDTRSIGLRADMDALPNNSKINEFHSILFNTPGVYLYGCSPHLNMGMLGLIVVDNDFHNLEDVNKVELSYVANSVVDRLIKIAKPN